MTTNKVKCPECGKAQTVHGKEYFHCCGSRWKIVENLIGTKAEEIEDEEEEEEIDVNPLPARRKPPRKVKKEEDELICPYCKGDVLATEQEGVYYCDVCKMYLRNN